MSWSLRNFQRMTRQSPWTILTVNNSQVSNDPWSSTALTSHAPSCPSQAVAATRTRPNSCPPLPGARARVRCWRRIHRARLNYWRWDKNYDLNHFNTNSIWKHMHMLTHTAPAPVFFTHYHTCLNYYQPSDRSKLNVTLMLFYYCLRNSLMVVFDRPTMCISLSTNSM